MEDDKGIDTTSNKLKPYHYMSYKYRFDCVGNWDDYNMYRYMKYDYYKITLKQVKQLCKMNHIKNIYKYNKEDLVNILIDQNILEESFRKPKYVEITEEDISAYALKK